MEGAAGSMPLAALPKDVLRIILKKLSLEDRLRVELVDKSHRDMMRDRELWQELNLGAMQALSITEGQLLRLLGRIDAGFEQIFPELESMAGTLKDIAEESLKHIRGPLVQNLDSFRLDVSYFGADMVSAGARYFSRLRQLVPEAWGPCRLVVETCTAWFADQVDRLFVNMLVSGQYIRRTNFLKGFNPEGLEGTAIDPEFDPMRLFAVTLYKNSRFCDITTASKTVSRDLEEKVWRLVERRLEIAKAAGVPSEFRKGCLKPRIVASTVVFENMAIHAESKLFEEIRDFLNESPSKLRLVFRHCLLLPAEFRSLCTLLGECGAGFVSFQQFAFPLGRLCNPQTEDAVLSSVALQKSGNLQSLELDCPLVVADLDSAAQFLDRSESAARLVIHLRTEFFSTGAETTQLFFKKLQELCASERGARVTVVQHRRGARASETVESARAGSSDAFSPIQDEISTVVWYEKLLTCVDKVLYVYTAVDLVLALAFLFGVKLFGYRLQPTNLATGLSGSWGVWHLWRPVRATIQGRRDWVGIAGGLFLSGLLPISPLVIAFKAFWAYIAIFLVRTVLWQVGRAIIRAFAS
ncbi:hypothetical protein KFL_005370040 [Klebsormidium nitens]|uniref:F-box domain-containing protein n=1 Tax=Klebsormidium nitens TaxID=105231 RepID=A0A1Y1ILQ6_KLENI|nr:hypothetical protein KFL_005370040 [Klebsormidium nitens]|eukprot:GAQ89567.1 hypothetical protein KFL_005370040 [Klebsormidium nitens]